VRHHQLPLNLLDQAIALRLDPSRLGVDLVIAAIA